MTRRVATLEVRAHPDVQPSLRDATRGWAPPPWVETHNISSLRDDVAALAKYVLVRSKVPSSFARADDEPTRPSPAMPTKPCTAPEPLSLRGTKGLLFWRSLRYPRDYRPDKRTGGASGYHHQKRAETERGVRSTSRSGTARPRVLGIIRRLWASALAAAGPSDTAAVRWWFQEVLCVRKSVFIKVIHSVFGSGVFISRST